MSSGLHTAGASHDSSRQSAPTRPWPTRSSGSGRDETPRLSQHQRHQPRAPPSSRMPPPIMSHRESYSARLRDPREQRVSAEPHAPPPDETRHEVRGRSSSAYRPTREYPCAPPPAIHRTSTIADSMGYLPGEREREMELTDISLDHDYAPPAPLRALRQSSPFRDYRYHPHDRYTFAPTPVRPPRSFEFELEVDRPEDDLSSSIYSSVHPQDSVSSLRDGRDEPRLTARPGSYRDISDLELGLQYSQPFGWRDSRPQRPDGSGYFPDLREEPFIRRQPFFYESDRMYLASPSFYAPGSSVVEDDAASESTQERLELEHARHEHYLREGRRRDRARRAAGAGMSSVANDYPRRSPLIERPPQISRRHQDDRYADDDYASDEGMRIGYPSNYHPRDRRGPEMRERRRDESFRRTSRSKRAPAKTSQHADEDQDERYKATKTTRVVEITVPRSAEVTVLRRNRSGNAKK